MSEKKAKRIGESKVVSEKSASSILLKMVYFCSGTSLDCNGFDSALLTKLTWDVSPPAALQRIDRNKL